MCPNCRAFITVDDKTCPYCEFQPGPRAIERRDAGELIGGLIPHAQFVTALILLVNCGLYAATMAASANAGNPNWITSIDGRTLFWFGSKFPRAIELGQVWRLVTAGFLHGGVMHILMNSWSLFDLGATVEAAFGWTRLVPIYFVSTVTGFYLSYLWSPNPSVGASAGIFGLLGAMIAYGYQNRSTMGQMMKSHYSRWALFGFLMSLAPQIDLAAHAGGFAGGFAVAYLAGLPTLKTWVEKAWDGFSLLCLGLTALAFYEMATFLFSVGQP